MQRNSKNPPVFSRISQNFRRFLRFFSGNVQNSHKKGAFFANANTVLSEALTGVPLQPPRAAAPLWGTPPPPHDSILPPPRWLLWVSTFQLQLSTSYFTLLLQHPTYYLLLPTPPSSFNISLTTFFIIQVSTNQGGGLEGGGIFYKGFHKRIKTASVGNTGSFDRRMSPCL